jgi:hypothetical protein
MSWDRWGRRLLVAGLAIVTGTFARRVYDAKVRDIGRPYAAGQRTTRGGRFTCGACGAGFRVAAGEIVPACPACANPRAFKTG